MSYLRNRWYVAAWADEVAEGKPLARTLCDEPVVLFRAGGQVAALKDRCPHRFAPLSYGTVRDGELQCRYHGLRFDATGACVSNPHGPLSAALRVAAFPVVERHKIVWIWMGAAAEASPALIPHLPFLSEAKPTAFNKGYLKARAHYLLLVDNVLDLSHTDFLHPASLGGGGKDGRGSITGTRAEVQVSGEGLLVRWANESAVPNPMEIATMSLPPHASVHRAAEVSWLPAAVMVLTSVVTAAEAREARPYQLRNLHIMTPETAKTTHYFFASTRDFAQDDAALNEQIAAGRKRIFESEDEWMCRGVQERMGDADFWDLRPALFATDAASVQMRRAMTRLLEAEVAMRSSIACKK